MSDADYEEPAGEPPVSGQLPAPYLRRLEPVPERQLYVARPGIRAMPSGTLAVLSFAALQAWTLTILLWAVWWPYPQSHYQYAFAYGCTAAMIALVIGVAWLLLRQYPGFLLAVMRAPFIRVTVTDQRVLWTVPWHRAPLMEIGRNRVLGGLLGLVDARGFGNAAIMLVPGDPAADVDGNIHFDRLPNAPGFVAALGGM